jgi:nucleoside-diphosphate-sugar epimerase
MRVFITGASGHVASAVIPELLGAGHQVVGLARSDRSAAAVAALGAEVRRGDLDNPDSIGSEAAAADGVIHLAFNHDAMRAGDLAGAAATEMRVVEAIGAALAGSSKPFVSTSGTLMLTLAGITGRAGTEHDALEAGPRVDSENLVVGLAERGVRSSVVRLPPITHSTLDTHGFAPTLIGIARERGVSGYVGDGANRWPSVHTLDAARLYRLALEAAPAGSRLHAVDDEGVPFREIAGAIARNLDVPTASVAPEDAGEHFSFLGGFVGLDNLTSSAQTRSLLGWAPEHSGLIADLDEGHYFTRDGATQSAVGIE